MIEKVIVMSDERYLLMGSEIVHYLKNDKEYLMVPDSILYYNELCLS